MAEPQPRSPRSTGRTRLGLLVRGPLEAARGTVTHPKGDCPIQVLGGAVDCARWRELRLGAALRRRHIGAPRPLLLSRAAQTVQARAFFEQPKRAPIPHVSLTTVGRGADPGISDSPFPIPRKNTILEVFVQARCFPREFSVLHALLSRQSRSIGHTQPRPPLSRASLQGPWSARYDTSAIESRTTVQASARGNADPPDVTRTAENASCTCAPDRARKTSTVCRSRVQPRPELTVIASGPSTLQRHIARRRRGRAACAIAGACRPCGHRHRRATGSRRASRRESAAGRPATAS